VTDIWDNLLRMASALALVLALLLLLAAVAKRVLGGRFPLAAGTPLVRIVGSGYLGPRKAVSLVSVAGEFFVVGTTQSDIVPLGRLTDQEAAKRLMSDDRQQTDSPPSPWQQLRQAWQQRSEDVPAHQDEGRP